jgi:CRISPR-associated endonuclease/helicase Cas3
MGRGDSLVRQHFFAHSLEGRPLEDWQHLEDHLGAVAERAGLYASEFRSTEWGRMAGLWHDFGKAQPGFQRYIIEGGERVDHASVGAALAYERDKNLGSLLAFLIAGHHGGLPNRLTDDQATRQTLAERVEKGRRLLAEVDRQSLSALRSLSVPQLPAELLPRTRAEGAAAKRRIDLWLRMLFSCLVDADFLDTEAFCNPAQAAERGALRAAITELRQRLDDYLDGLASAAPRTAVNGLRAEVLEGCRLAAGEKPGFFSLTVPTGGGKTLSAMAFALRHAEAHGLSRVIVAIPFTTIIEQNAEVYRRVFGDANVVEHHSNIEPAKETQANRLASENWDAPIVVTTNVQLFESLFASTPSQCRKLHNIARSIIVLDEAQTLPAGFLTPIMEIMRELVATYGCSIVLSTATQPALNQRPALPGGLERVREIVRDPAALADRLRRVSVEWPSSAVAPVSWDDLAAEVRTLPQALVVVHRREDAAVLCRMLPEADRFHLSALMCAKHRTRVLADVRRALTQGECCRLVSTQLIEAGVDVDFPVVFRALAGLDSLAQAAGRCNREGRATTGRFVVFLAPTPPPVGALRQGFGVTQAMLKAEAAESPLNLLAPDTFLEYFRRLYFHQDLDVHQVQVERAELNFETVDRKVRLIADASRPVVVPFGDSPALVGRLWAEGPSAGLLRRLQPYTVAVYSTQLDELVRVGAVELVHDVIHVLRPTHADVYGPEFGLAVDKPTANAAAFVL